MNLVGDEQPESGRTSTLTRFLEHVQSPLYKNAYALIANTGLTAGLGALYWVAAARAYDAKDVGKASALIAAMMLISAVTQLNLTSVLVRFLPRAGTNARRLVVGSYAMAAGVAAVVTSVVLVVAHFVSSSGSLLHLSGWFAIAFVIATVIWSIFGLQDCVLTGLRRSIVVPIENTAYGAVKIVALLAFVPVFASSGIFASWVIPTALALVPINWLIFRRYLPAHVDASGADQQPLIPRQIARFVAGDYLSGLFAQASTVLLPLIVLAVLGPSANAYFYIAQIIGTSLDKVSFSLAASLTVEAATDERKFIEYTRSVFQKGLLMVSAAAVVIIIGAPWILQIFGTEYRENATGVLQLLTLASIPRVIPMVYGSVARHQHKTHHIAYITFVQAVFLVGGSVLLMPGMGVAGVGVAALASQVVIASFVLPLLLRAMR